MKKGTSGIMMVLALVGIIWAESTQTEDWIATELTLSGNWTVDESIVAPDDVWVALYEGETRWVLLGW